MCGCEERCSAFHGCGTHRGCVLNVNVGRGKKATWGYSDSRDVKRNPQVWSSWGAAHQPSIPKTQTRVNREALEALLVRCRVNTLPAGTSPSPFSEQETGLLFTYSFNLYLLSTSSVLGTVLGSGIQSDRDRCQEAHRWTRWVRRWEVLCRK